MIIKKKADTYNTYTLEVSWGQLEAFRAALEADHTDPVRDETCAELAWYMDRIPGPGQEEKEIEAQQKMAKQGGQPGAVEGEDIPIPMPPGSEAGTSPETGANGTPPPSEEEMAGGEPGDWEGGEPEGGPEDQPGGGPEEDVGLPEPESEGGFQKPKAGPEAAAKLGARQNGRPEPKLRLAKPPRE